MRPMSEFLQREVMARCVSDHHSPIDPDDPDYYVLVDSARIIGVKPGHPAPIDGICPTCGLLSADDPRYSPGDNACFSRADWVVELRYHVTETLTFGRPKRVIRNVEYGAVYGVKLEGDRADIALWMD